MQNYHVVVMSEDPNDHSEDPHQKYGLSIQAKNEKDAIEKGAEEFKRRYKGLPIFWVKAYQQSK